MRIIAPLALILLTTGCNYSPSDPLEVRWAVHMPEITEEPNHQIMLDGNEGNFCMLSIMNSSLKIGSVVSESHPGKPSIDIDCYWDDHYFVIDDTNDTFAKATITGSSNDLLTITLDTSLVDVFSKDRFSVNQSFLLSTDPNHYDIPSLTMRNKSPNVE